MLVVPEKKSAGIQTDEVDESLNPSTSGSTSTHDGFSSLRLIWSPLSSERSRRNFVAKLLEACASDFCVLFGCLGLNMTSKMDSDCLTHEPMPEKIPGLNSAEASKVSQLYSVLTKVLSRLFFFFFNYSVDIILLPFACFALFISSVDKCV